MVLFSSFSHLNILLLFAYLGLMSGMIFYFVYYLAKFVKLRTKKTRKEIKLSTNKQVIVEKIKLKIKKTKNLKMSKDQKKSFKEIKQKNTQNKKNKKQQIKEKTIYTLKNFYLKVINFLEKTQNVFLIILCCITLIFVVAISYYINFVLNYGQIRIVFVLVWVGCFLLVGSIAKKVANLLLNFYNKKRKKQLIQNNNLLKDN